MRMISDFISIYSRGYGNDKNFLFALREKEEIVS